jgi:transketolase
MPTIDRAKFGAATGLHQGAYVVAEATGGAPKAILMGTGSELGLAMTAREELEKAGVPTRVVSFPCFEAFAKQPAAYKESVLPAAIKARVSIEAGLTHGWERWVGERGIAIGVDTFGASAPDKVLYEQYGVTVAKLVAAAKSLVG